MQKHVATHKPQYSSHPYAPVASSLRTQYWTHTSREVSILLATVGVMPFCLEDIFKSYVTAHSGAPGELKHVLEEVFVISWGFILLKDVCQAGGITPTVARITFAFPPHSANSHPI
jgi:hypothetical protein